MNELKQDPLPKRIGQGLGKLSIAIRAKEQSGATGEGLSPTQGVILNRLARSGVGRVSELARELAVSLPTVSDAVAVLVSKGYVEKRRAGNDGRALLLHLTREGRAVASRTSHWPDFLSTAADALNDQEQLAFHRGLVKMIRTLQDRGEIEVARMCVSCAYFRPGAHEGADKPHHCAFVDAAIGDRDLRIDCAEFEPASGDDAWQKWKQQ